MIKTKKELELKNKQLLGRISRALRELKDLQSLHPTNGILIAAIAKLEGKRK